jgi:hypothetical protein
MVKKMAPDGEFFFGKTQFHTDGMKKSVGDIKVKSVIFTTLYSLSLYLQLSQQKEWS